MRRKEKEITDKKEIENIIKKANVCRLAMVDGDKPYMVPMNFGYQDGHLFFHSAKQGRKIDIIKKNPRICFEFDLIVRFTKAKKACDWGLEYKSVIGSGRAALVDDLKEKIKGLNIIMSQYSNRSFEYSDEMLGQTLVIKVKIDNMTGKQSGK